MDSMNSDYAWYHHILYFSLARVTPLRRMTEAGRSGTIRAVNSLCANGSTNIIAELKLAVQILMQRREMNPVFYWIIKKENPEADFKEVSNIEGAKWKTKKSYE